MTTAKKKSRTRASWQQYFLDIAQLVSTRSTCKRRQVGAVTVLDNHILTTGYNGAPSGQPHCLTIGCLRDEQAIPSGERHEICRAIHAEQNAIIQSSIHGISLSGSTLYCTHQPCSICARMILNAKITKVIFTKGYSDSVTIKLLGDRLYQYINGEIIHASH